MRAMRWGAVAVLLLGLCAASAAADEPEVLLGVSMDFGKGQIQDLERFHRERAAGQVGTPARSPAIPAFELPDAGLFGCLALTPHGRFDTLPRTNSPGSEEGRCSGCGSENPEAVPGVSTRGIQGRAALLAVTTQCRGGDQPCAAVSGAWMR